MLKPYRHQDHFLSEIGKAHEAQDRVLAQLTTGGGKTVCTGEDTRRRLELDQRIWILVHRREIGLQQQKTLRKFGIEPGMIMAGEKPMPDAPVQVAMVQTLTRRLRDGINLPDHIHVDEAHHDKAATWSKIHEFAPGATKTGWTATPVPGLDKCFEAIVEGPSATWLTNNGFLVPAEYWAPTIPDMSGIPSRAGDWTTEGMSKALARSMWLGDPVQSWRDHLWPGATAVGFCINVAHAEMEAARFNAAGIRAAVLTGEAPQDKRDAMLAALAPGGDLDIIMTVDVVSEGFDLPSIDSVFLMRPSKSLALVRQQVGRALRTFEGKKAGVILDHTGNIWRHGPITDEIEWDLAEGETKASRDRRLADDDTPLSMIRCDKCGHGYPAQLSACRKCGAEPPRTTRMPKWKAAKLQQIMADDAAKAERERKAAFEAEKKKCKNLGDWQLLAQKWGYKPGWAWRMSGFQEKGRRSNAAKKDRQPSFGIDGWPV